MPLPRPTTCRTRKRMYDGISDVLDGIKRRRRAAAGPPASSGRARKSRFPNSVRYPGEHNLVRAGRRPVRLAWSCRTELGWATPGSRAGRRVPPGPRSSSITASSGPKYLIWRQTQLEPDHFAGREACPPPPGQVVHDQEAASAFVHVACPALSGQLRGVVAEGLQEQYFKDRGRRAAGLQVELTDIDYIELDF